MRAFGAFLCSAGLGLFLFPTLAVDFFASNRSTTLRMWSRHFGARSDFRLAESLIPAIPMYVFPLLGIAAFAVGVALIVSDVWPSKEETKSPG